MSILKKRTESIQKQVDTILQFVKEPKGVFETADEMIQQFRGANRKTLRSLTGEGVSMRGLIEERTKMRGGL